MTEKELIKKSKEGDIKSFEKLIVAHENRVYSIALKMLRNEHDAFDASQEAFLKAYKYINNFKEKSTFSTWIYRITTNVCLDILKKNKESLSNISIESQISLPESEVSFQIEDKDSNTEEEILKRERKKVIADAIGRLSDDHRQMIVLRDIEGFSYDEIAEITGRNIGTVKSKINRARLALKELLNSNRELFFIFLVLLLTK